jgi:hypothetical protein
MRFSLQCILELSSKWYLLCYHTYKWRACLQGGGGRGDVGEGWQLEGSQKEAKDGEDKTRNLRPR